MTPVHTLAQRQPPVPDPFTDEAARVVRLSALREHAARELAAAKQGGQDAREHAQEACAALAAADALERESAA